MDQQVQAAQHWLNTTYGSVAGWVPLDEDGVTGWATMYALRRALQTELGISPVSSGFGPATTAAFVAKIGRIDGSTTSVNLLRILSAALWCKGYAGLLDQDEVTFANLTLSVGYVRDDLGLGSADPYVDVKLMASLLSMDAYVLLASGSDRVRAIQRWFNATYLQRADFAVVPCDGIWSRQTQIALLFAVQYEIGMADGVANGNFGPGTRAGLQSKAPVGPGSVDGATRFVHLYQAGLRFNGYPVPFSGSFDVDTETHTRRFQEFMALPVSGRGDYSTWCALLVSSGDTTIATKGFDSSTQLTPAEAQGAVGAGYTAVVRYTVGSGKFITAPELDGLRAAGLRLFPIHQRYNNSADVMTYAIGRLHGIEATERCRVLGLPSGTLVFFAVDFDPVGETINGPVCDYFRGVNDSIAAAITTTYRVGVYGSRNVCATVIRNGYAEAAFVAGMSTGYGGNLGFPMPSAWHLNQIAGTSVQFAAGGRSVGIDKDVVSSRARPVDLAAVVSPPVEQDGSVSATGFDAFFEWLVRAEVACERGLSAASTPDAALIPSYLTHWLQQPTYWGDANSGFWPLYTPVVDGSTNERLARAAAEDALGALSPNRPVSNRDIARFAAAARGYQVWGLPRATDDYGLGDLGGWALDLLRLWGSYLRAKQADPGLDLDAYCRSEIASASGSGGFGWSVVVADADAYLLRAALHHRAGSLSGALRLILRQTSAQRVLAFYRKRFGGSAAQLADAFGHLTEDRHAGAVRHRPSGRDLPFSKDLLLRAAKADRWPTSDEAEVCARAYADAMASLS